MSCENFACHQQTRSTVHLGDVVIVLTSLHASLTSTRNCERPSQAPSVFTESITTFQSKFNPLSLVILEPLPLALVPLFQKTAMTFTPLVQVRSSVVLPQRVFNQKNTSSEQENRFRSPKTSYTVNWGDYSAFNLLKDVFRNQFPL